MITVEQAKLLARQSELVALVAAHGRDRAGEMLIDLIAEHHHDCAVTKVAVIALEILIAGGDL